MKSVLLALILNFSFAHGVETATLLTVDGKYATAYKQEILRAFYSLHGEAKPLKFKAKIHGDGTATLTEISISVADKGYYIAGYRENANGICTLAGYARSLTVVNYGEDEAYQAADLRPDGSVENLYVARPDFHKRNSCPSRIVSVVCAIK